MPKPADNTNTPGSVDVSERALSAPGGPGSYVLVLHLPAPARLAIGRLGEFEFQPGWYLYCGSAMGGLRGRVARHMRRDHRMHWHIDYLNSPGTGATVEAVWWAEGRSRRECEWAQAIGDLPGNNRPVAGFGSSDCGCESHLIYSPALPSPGEAGWRATYSPAGLVMTDSMRPSRGQAPDG